MKGPKTAAIALGSNQGDRFKNLQVAIDEIHLKAGTVQKISRVYRTPAEGFEGPEFLNACILLKTYLSPHGLLKALLRIEQKMGRERKNLEQPESRPIDLDLLIFEDAVKKTKRLTVPHPSMSERMFVLKPLDDIAPELLHPKLNKTVAELLMELECNTELEPINIWLKNPSKVFNFKDYNYIAVEGNIGAGKTSLATMISREFNAKLILERFADNPFLPKFYKDPQRYAFTLEMSFLADRYQQISDDLSQLDLFRDFIVSDYDVYKSLIFSKITLPED
ncbi:MAG: 2-amino-4-hydroxy-6-hydroxymethyldihydropteridine diphosphokinase, partial [Bacteroidia bacterium]|nr:2-amino-4-hydroxy-6-hydroxymethyldihydropteridine diphosphokinase [Bacteroidia bacterium]